MGNRIESGLTQCLLGMGRKWLNFMFDKELFRKWVNAMIGEDRVEMGLYDVWGWRGGV